MKLLIFNFVVLVSCIASAGSWVSVSNFPVQPVYPDYSYQYTCKVELSDRKTYFTDGGQEFILVARLPVDFSKSHSSDQQAISSYKLTQPAEAWQIFRFYPNRPSKKRFEKTKESVGFNLDKHEVRVYVNSETQSRVDNGDDRVVFEYSVAQKLDDRFVRWKGLSQNIKSGQKQFSGVVKTSVDYKPGVESLWLEMHVDCERLK